MRTPIVEAGLRLVPLGRIASLDLELGVLRPAQQQASSPAEVSGRDEPSPAVADEHEQVVAVLGLQSFRETVPALVAASGADGDLPPALVEPRSRLDFHSH